MDEIIDYLTRKYSPSGIIVYGSFSDGSNGENSDFDALLIAGVPEKLHDASIVSGITLDVFVYPAAAFFENTAMEDFVQLYDGKILLDTDGTAARVLREVRTFIDSKPRKTPSENTESLKWCEKMLSRTRRGDSEGYFRWHWLLTDSLEIYFDLIGQPYFGPKKGIAKMRESDPEAFTLYAEALESFDEASLARWIEHLKKEKKS